MRDQTDACELLVEHEPDRRVDQVWKERTENKHAQIHPVIAKDVAGDGDRRPGMPEEHRQSRLLRERECGGSGYSVADRSVVPLAVLLRSV